LQVEGLIGLKRQSQSPQIEGAGLDREAASPAHHDRTGDLEAAVGRARRADHIDPRAAQVFLAVVGGVIEIVVRQNLTLRQPSAGVVLGEIGRVSGEVDGGHRVVLLRSRR
jgi:hypothetical protein